MSSSIWEGCSDVEEEKKQQSLEGLGSRFEASSSILRMSDGADEEGGEQEEIRTASSLRWAPGSSPAFSPCPCLLQTNKGDSGEDRFFPNHIAGSLCEQQPWEM